MSNRKIMLNNSKEIIIYVYVCNILICEIIQSYNVKWNKVGSNNIILDKCILLAFNILNCTIDNHQLVLKACYYYYFYYWYLLIEIWIFKYFFFYFPTLNLLNILNLFVHLPFLELSIINLWVLRCELYVGSIRLGQIVRNLGSILVAKANH